MTSNLSVLGISLETTTHLAPTSVDDLLNRVHAWLVDDGSADESSKWIETKNSLAAQLAQAELGSDFSAVSILGKKLLAHQATATQLVVSEEKYRSMPERRAQLIAELKMESLLHIKANRFNNVRQLASALGAVYATAERYKAENRGTTGAPVDSVTLSLAKIDIAKDTKDATSANKVSPGIQDHTSPTSVAVLSALVPSADPTLWDPCYVPSPRENTVDFTGLV